MSQDIIYTEPDLLRKIAIGDENAFRIIFQKFWPRIYANALKFTKSPEQAKDHPPKEKVESEVVFNNDITAVSAMTGVYHDLIIRSTFACGDISSIVALAGLSSDELIPGNLDPLSPQNLNDKVDFIK